MIDPEFGDILINKLLIDWCFFHRFFVLTEFCCTGHNRRCFGWKKVKLQSKITSVICCNRQKFWLKKVKYSRITKHLKTITEQVLQFEITYWLKEQNWYRFEINLSRLKEIQAFWTTWILSCFCLRIRNRAESTGARQQSARRSVPAQNPRQVASRQTARQSGLPNRQTRNLRD